MNIVYRRKIKNRKKIHVLTGCDTTSKVVKKKKRY